MEACAFRPERLGEPSFRTTLTRRPGFALELEARPNEKTGTRASGVPAGTARPLNCHDPGTRRTGHLESGRLLRAGGRQVKGRPVSSSLNRVVKRILPPDAACSTVLRLSRALPAPSRAACPKPWPAGVSEMMTQSVSLPSRRTRHSSVADPCSAGATTSTVGSVVGGSVGGLVACPDKMNAARIANGSIVLALSCSRQGCLFPKVCHPSMYAGTEG